ncbi:hypothetical protein [Streptomyces sp. NPDC101150]|uniref:hypothetical protein n=1 Tax=Streptomyces sp. NPDC101150 TaxID=3366114 RepID=UPI00381D49AC
MSTARTTPMARETTPRRPARRPAARALALTAAAGLTLIAGAVGAPSASAADNVKYYVVRSAEQNGGHKETLCLIAQRVLHDCNRFQEIFNLNKGRVQPGGATFSDPNSVEAGYVLQLPADATGTGVQVGPLPEAGQAQPVVPRSGHGTTPDAGRAPVTQQSSGNPFTGIGDRVSLPLVGLGAGGVALLTLLVVFRKAFGRGLRRSGKGMGAAAYALRPRLPQFAELALRRRRRESLGRRLAADTRTPLVVRHAVHELVRQPDESGPVRVYSALATPSRISVAVSGGAAPPPEWTAVTPNRWERTGHPAIGDLDTAWEVSCPHLVRVGWDGDTAAQVLVDLAQINGALSLTGDLAVAQDTIAALVRGLLDAPRQRTVVLLVDPTATAMPGFQGVLRIPTAHELVGKAPAQVLEGAEGLGLGLVKGAARSGPVNGFVVVPNPASYTDAQVLSELSSPEGGSWIVLAVGDVHGAHWRWHAHPDGLVDTGVLGLRVVVPGQTRIVSGAGATTAAPGRQTGVVPEGRLLAR